MNTLGFAYTLFFRKQRCPPFYLLGLSLFFASLLVTFFHCMHQHVHNWLSQQPVEYLGADAVIISPTPIPQHWHQRAHKQGLETLTVMDTFTIFTYKAAWQRVHVNAIPARFPLYGQMKGYTLHSPDTPQSIPPLHHHNALWITPAVSKQLGVKCGDQVYAWGQAWTITSVLTQFPVSPLGVFSTAPDVFIDLPTLEKSQRLDPDTHKQYRFFIAGPPSALQPYLRWLNTQQSPTQKKRTPDQPIHPAVTHIVSLIIQCLAWVQTGSLFLACIAIYRASEYVLKQQLPLMALLHSLGYPKRQLFSLYGVLFQCLSLPACLLGTLAGLGVYLATLHLWPHAAYLPTPHLPNGLTIVFSFATALFLFWALILPLLWQIKRPSAHALLQSARHPPAITPPYWGWAITLSPGISVWLYQHATTLMQAQVGYTLLFVCTVLAIMTALTGGTFVVCHAIRQHPLSVMLGVGVRYGLARLWHYRYSHTLLIVSFGSILSVIGILFLFYSLFLHQWHTQIPSPPPNYFVFNIKSRDKSAFMTLMKKEKLTPSPLYPLLRGKLIAINTHPLPTLDTLPTMTLQRRLNLTWSATLPPGNRLTQGQWWTRTMTPHPYVSVEANLGKQLGLKPGDTLTFHISDRRKGHHLLHATVHHFRQVNWLNLQPNFYFILSPSPILEKITHTWMLNVHIPPEKRNQIREWMQSFPHFIWLDIEQIFTRVITFTHAALQLFSLLVTLITLSALCVLLVNDYTQLHLQKMEWFHLQQLGMQPRQRYLALCIEHGFIGLLSGSLASINMGMALWKGSTLFTGIRALIGPIPLHYIGQIWLILPLASMLCIGSLSLISHALLEAHKKTLYTPNDIL